LITVKPFKALRPTKDLYPEISSLPYDVPTLEECREIVSKNNKSLLRIIRSEVEFENVDPHSDIVYNKAKEIFNDFIKKGYLKQDEKECFYAYRLINGAHSQTGFITVISALDYEEGRIKRHEKTRIDKENDRVRNIETIGAQTGFIFLIYKSKEELNKILKNIEKGVPDAEFTSGDNVTHSFWKIADDELIAKIKNEFKKIDSVYIADGHHRCAASAAVAKKKAEASKTKEIEANYMLSIIYPDSSLKILPYNRVVKDLNGLSKEEFIKKIEINFEIKKVNPNDKKGYAPVKQKNIGVYLSGQWYLLTPKNNIIKNDPLSFLDVSILQDNILDPVLNIKDPRTDKRIDFIGGNKNSSYLTDLVDKNKFIAAFSMYPTSVAELMAIADSNNLMPPKSTWFEPKPRSGMAIHLLD